MHRGTTGRAGVWVQDVVSGSPAAAAGVRPGDHILRVNGTAVPDPMKLAALVRKLGPGATTRLEYLPRDGGEPRVREVRLGDYTSDYRMHLIWHRLLSRRASNLEEARSMLRHQLDIVDGELRRVRSLEPDARAQSLSR
jgi:predicted metalloprotease with PDZ domain